MASGWLDSSILPGFLQQGCGLGFEPDLAVARCYLLNVRLKSTAATAPDSRPTRFRWRIVVLLMAAAAINYLDRSCMGMAAPKIQEEFGLSTTQIGYVIGVFQYGYLLSYLGSGVLVDRLGARWGYVLIMAAWSAVGAMTAIGSRLWHFLLCRFSLGVAEAGCWPSSNKVVAQWFPRVERPLACGLFDSGSALAQVFGPPVLAAIILHWGWRTSFIAAGSLGFIWILVWLRMFHTPEEHPSVNAAELAAIRHEPDASRQEGVETDAGSVPWRRLLRCRQVWGIFVLNAATSPLWFVLYNWLPKYFYDARGVRFDKLGWYSALPMVGSALGGTLGSTILVRLLRRPGMTATVARRRMFLLDVTIMAALIPAVRCQNVLHSALYMALVAFGLGLHSANVLSSVSDFVPARLVATVTGLQASGTFLYSLPIATFAGWVVERFGYSPLFVFAALHPWLAIVSANVIIRKFEPISGISTQLAAQRS